MNIVVCIKQVPDTNEVKIDPVTNNLVREGVPSIINPFDQHAVEEALQIREVEGGMVTVVSMGPPQASEALQAALDMGADRAILLSDRLLSGSDTLATGYALSTLIKSLKPDLILCGNEAIDGCTGQVGPIIAENLGLPQFTYVSDLKIDKRKISVSREMKEGYELLTCQLPAVVCVLKTINKPRKPSSSERAPEIWSAKDAGLDEARIGISGSPTRVAKIDMSNRRGTSYIEIDYKLPADERIKLIINGGMQPKKVTLTRGTPEYLAKVIFDDEILSSHLAN